MRTSEKGYFVPVSRGWWCAWVMGVCLASFGGCERASWMGMDHGKEEASGARDDQADLARKTAALPGTVGAAASLEGMGDIFVEGYGLVGGLAGKGSRECPEPLRAELIEAIAKAQKTGGFGDRKDLPSPMSIIRSGNTAVVRVRGRLPGGASKGERFDVSVEALPNTGTTSLEGGWLYSCDLRVFGGPASGGARSKIMARAAGPVFINPFEKRDYQGTTMLHRSGFVLGGGSGTVDRPLSLVLYQGSYEIARAIEQKINTAFGPVSGGRDGSAAKAVSPNRVELRIPAEYGDRKSYFLALVNSLYVRSDPNFIDVRSREQVSEIMAPLANAEAISFAWEGMGRTVLPVIQGLYGNSNQQASFWSSRAGAALGDTLAIERLGGFATSAGPYRVKAVEQLGYCRSPVASEALRKVVASDDVDLRILAYEGLSRAKDASVKRGIVGVDRFLLDMVSCGGRPLVYVTRTAEPKVVVFGSARIEPPVFYSDWDRMLTISANTEDRELSVVRRLPPDGSSIQAASGLEVSRLLGLLGGQLGRDGERYTGMGVPYNRVISVLHSLYDSGALAGVFKLQDMSVWPDRTAYELGRPERDE